MYQVYKENNQRQTPRRYQQYRRYIELSYLQMSYQQHMKYMNLGR
jgi:hypothetical protein